MKLIQRRVSTERAVRILHICAQNLQQQIPKMYIESKQIFRNCYDPVPWPNVNASLRWASCKGGPRERSHTIEPDAALYLKAVTA